MRIFSCLPGSAADCWPPGIPVQQPAVYVLCKRGEASPCITHECKPSCAYRSRACCICIHLLQVKPTHLREEGTGKENVETKFGLGRGMAFMGLLVAFQYIAVPCHPGLGWLHSLASVLQLSDGTNDSGEGRKISVYLLLCQSGLYLAACMVLPKLFLVTCKWRETLGGCSCSSTPADLTPRPSSEGFLLRMLSKVKNTE